jgi:hypothetical protein
VVGKVEEDRAASLRFPHLHDRLADLQREVGLGLVEVLGGVLETQVAAGQRAFGVLEHHPGAVDGEFLALLAAHPEHQLAEARGGGVVEVDGGAARAAQALHGALDELLTGLDQDRDADVVGDAVLLHQHADEVVVVGAGGGEADLDLLVPHADQQVEHHQLALGAHRRGEGLFAVAEVGGEPAGRGGDRRAGPGAVVEGDPVECGITADLHRRIPYCLHIDAQLSKPK